MRAPVPPRLPENAGLVFVGGKLPPACVLPHREASAMLRHRNSHGKPNADVLRPIANGAGLDHPGTHWLIDFPSEMDEAEASLYARPFHHLTRAISSPRRRWWANCRRDQTLRAILARRERFLATPIGRKYPTFTWVDSSAVPDETLLVVARDDDFTRGILQSPLFACWWGRFHSRQNPTLVVGSFPFPWPLGTALGALTSKQEEQRHAVAQADRGGNPERVHATVSAAYGFPTDLGEHESLSRLWVAGHERAGIAPRPLPDKKAASARRLRLQ